MAEGPKKTAPWSGKRKPVEGAGIMAKKLVLQPVNAVQLDLPVPVSVNALFFNNKKGKGKGRIRTPAYNAWIAEATYDARRQGVGRIEGRYTLDIEIKRGSTKADLWNLEKSLSDLLQEEGFISNDRLCDGGTIRWSEDVEGARITLKAVQ